jgi:DNA-binding Lrp family transcriptional regulator
MSEPMGAVDRRILNATQGDFPICDRPFLEAARSLGLDEEALIEHVRAMCDDGRLSRFGPMYNAERLGGAVTLAAMAVPRDRFEVVAAMVNAHPEVAHNYAREDALNMWFVVATEAPERIVEVVAAIEAETGIKVYNMPKEREFFVGLRFEV